MRNALDQLPDDVYALKSLFAAQATKLDEVTARNEQLAMANHRYQAQVLTLTEQLNLALARRHAVSSEKLSPDQIRLFDEDETQTVFPAEDETVTVPGRTRRKWGRKPLPAALPRAEVIHVLSDSERVCPHGGNLLSESGAVTSEQLDIILAKIQVIRHIRKQYACRCDQCIKTAPLASQPIPKNLASPGLLAHIAVSKYQDALPLYRQETILQRIGVDSHAGELDDPDWRPDPASDQPAARALTGL